MAGGNAAPRQPHIEPLFEDVEFVAAYNWTMKTYAGADIEPILRYTLQRLADVDRPRVLEIGPGPGWLGIALAKRRADLEVIGIDISETYLQVACENALNEGVADRVQFRRGDVLDLSDFEAESFDAVISNQSFHYWEPPQQAFDEMARVVKPDGHYCIADDRRDMSLLAAVVVVLTRWLLPAAVRQSWMRSIQGAYTVAEARGILESSALQGSYSVLEGERMFYIQGCRQPKCIAPLAAARLAAAVV